MVWLCFSLKKLGTSRCCMLYSPYRHCFILTQLMGSKLCCWKGIFIWLLMCPHHRDDINFPVSHKDNFRSRKSLWIDQMVQPYFLTGFFNLPFSIVCLYQDRFKMLQSNTRKNKLSLHMSKYVIGNNTDSFLVPQVPKHCGYKCLLGRKLRPQRH